MDDEIEDIVGDVQYTDSQKSLVAPSSNMYSPDFTDCSSRSSDKNNSSGKETYVIEWDSEDSEKNFPLHDCISTLIGDTQQASLVPSTQRLNLIQTRSAATIQHRCSIVAQEIYTQTSKTIIELAETDGNVKRTVESSTLETQTSLVSITENKTVEHRIEVSSAHENFAKGDVMVDQQEPLPKKSAYFNVRYNQIPDSLDEASSKFPISETENEVTVTGDNDSECSSVLRITNDDSNETVFSGEKNELQFENTSDYEESIPADIEEDSLMEEPSKSACKEVKKLREIICENQIPIIERYEDTDIRRFGTLTPLTEESNAKKESLMDITPNINNIVEANRGNNAILFNNAEIMVKLLKDDDSANDSFRLPPIHNNSCPNSPHLNSLFGKTKMSKAGTLPSLYERQSLQDRWEIKTKNLASGESPFISVRSESPRKPIQLPPIYCEVPNIVNKIAHATLPSKDGATEKHEPISIKDKIKELKMSTKPKIWPHKYNYIMRQESRSGSPGSATSPEDHRLCDIADRGCEILCVELLKRLRSSPWFEVVETLDDIPRVLEKFWEVITEQRIADLVRQVNMKVESPRPQVARAACASVAAILKNTNYTKKPDFYEAMTVLLMKTGSYSRTVRRAANVALDDIVCSVELTHAVCAICLHGVGHKNALVRCASARLLVVCCALASGGRDLLRARPATAAGARRHVLKALAALLDDKSTDTRKYAERLYSMLRPLTHFEAYYLTDVEVEVASRQMKKYDQLLLCGAPKAAS